MTIPNINKLKVIDTLQLLSRFSENLLQDPNNDETREQIKELIDEANIIINDFYEISNKSNT